MTEIRTFTLFYGHQFYSDIELSSEIRSAVMRACKSAEKSINRIRPSEAIRLKCNASQILSGEDVFTEVLSKIDGSDICVFNLSEKNANVIFELGYAHGRNKQTIWISNENLPLAEMPADFQGKFVVRYEGSTELEMLLEGEISKRLQSIVTIEENRDSFSEIWQLGSYRFVDLIFGALPAEDRSKYGRPTEKNYVRYQNFADVDTFVYLSRFLSRNFPNLDPRDYVPDEYAKDVDAPTFLVGGPFWNRAARRFYSFPDEISPLAVVPAYFREGPDGEDDRIYISKLHEELMPIENADGFFDIGFFAKFAHPETGHPVFIMSGCRTAGVLGAARCFGDTDLGRKNCQYVGKRDRDLRQFYAVFRVSVRDGNVHVPNLDSAALIHFDML